MKFVQFVLAFAGWILVTQVSGQSMTLALEGDEWKEVGEYPVNGKDGIFKKEGLTFGDITSLVVDRSWTKGTEVTSGLTTGIPTDEFYKKIITTDHINKKQTLYFSLGDDTGRQSQAYSFSLCVYSD